MKFSRRDRVLAIFLPALLIVLGYGTLFMSSKQSEFNRAWAAFDDTRTKAPALQNQVLQAQAKIAKLTSDYQQLEGDQVKVRRAWNAVAGRCADPSQRNGRIEKLNQVLARN